MVFSVKKLKLGYALAAGVVIAAEHFALAEGKGRYILFILAFYLTDHWPVRKKALLWLFLMPLSRYQLIGMFFSEQLFTYRWFHMLCINALGPLLGVASTFFYNGEKGRSFPGGKYLWYVFYPAHLPSASAKCSAAMTTPAARAYPSPARFSLPQSMSRRVSRPSSRVNMMFPWKPNRR